MENQYNKRSPAVKRLMREAAELRDPTSDYFAQPLAENLFEWHFTVRGPSDTEFEGGVYHGRIILPTEYPMKPPHIIILTPNGRFETNKKICLSISGHHPESWQPSWSIRTALLAIIGYMPNPGQGSLGSLDYPKTERIKLAKKSGSFVCQECNSNEPVSKLLKQQDPNAPSITEDSELKQIMASKEETPVKLTKEEAFIKKRKEASKKMQQRFREKLLARTPELVNQVEKAKSRQPASTTPTATAPQPRVPPSGDAAAATTAPIRDAPIRNNHVQDDQGHNRPLIGVLVALIVLVVAAVIYRRFSAFQRLFSVDDDEFDPEL